MPIGVYVDNNVWDFLFDRGLNLSVELPKDRFALCLTREAEFEIPPLASKRPELYAFIQDTIKSCSISTDYIFGFYDDSLPRDQQRYGGFDQGRFMSEEEHAFIQQQRQPLQQLRPKRPTGLYKDEADTAIAARSFRSVVLSLDRKKGPINNAYQQGGTVVFLTDFAGSGLSLADFITRNVSAS